MSEHSLECQHLLRDLKTTVEALLVTQVANVWLIYGGLNRLHSSVERIFQHGCKQSSEDNCYYKFINGLEWLQPENSKTYFSVDCEYKPHLPPHLKDDKASTWLYRSLENHSLSQKLSWLLSDKTHLSDCYHPHAYLCREEYAEACLICLRAVERNQPSLMSEVNPRLFVLKTNATEYHKVHRRCSSFPDNNLKTFLEDSRKWSRPSESGKLNAETVIRKCDSAPKVQCKLKPWRSVPDVQVDTFNIRNGLVAQSKTTPSTPVRSKKVNKLSPSVLKVDYDSLLDRKCKGKALQHRSSSFARKQKCEVKHVIIDNFNIIEHTPPLSSSQSSGTVIQDELASVSARSEIRGTRSPIRMSYSPRSMMDFLPMPGEKDYKRQPKKSFIEDGGMSVLPMATGYFPKPAKGQSLQSFLTSSQFSRTNAELDRENAHFSISEAIISAMEQIRCRRDERLADEQMDESDPEIIDLKQRIRLRRRQKMVEKHRKNLAHSLLSDGKTDTTTSASPCSSYSDTLSASISSDEVDDLQLDEASNLSDNCGLSMSMASLFSEADVMKRPRGAPDGASDVLSAEGVALSLISRFSEKLLPKASDLIWLVSEEDAPQALLPLPKSWPVSPDDSESPPTHLRGTQEWAPPRPQIIFTLHPSPVRKKLMESQNYRCAGCSMKVSLQYASRFRYCDYLGRYFCTGCHTNQLALIPAKIIHKWNFTRCPVSTFSYRLLEQMHSDPLFRIFDLNKNIGKKSSNLLFCRKYRLGLYYLKDYIFNCRFANDVKERLEYEVEHVLNDPEIYSLEDLVSIKSGEMKKKLVDLVVLCCKHTSECSLCLARGFICEVCKKDEVIFPWQLSKVRRCPKCSACYHIACWNPDNAPCKKCERIDKRRESTASTSKDNQ